MTQHSELYQRILQTSLDENARSAAFDASGPTPAAFRKMSKKRQEAHSEAKRLQLAGSYAQTFGERMTIACELLSPMEVIALMTRISIPQYEHTCSATMSDLLLGELIEKALEIESQRVTSIMRSVA